MVINPEPWVPPPPGGMAVKFELLRTRATSWRPAEARVALNARMDARIVPDSSFSGVSGSGSYSLGAQGPGCLPDNEPERPTPSAWPGSSAANGVSSGGCGAAAGSEQRSGSAAGTGKTGRERGDSRERAGAHCTERAGCGGRTSKGPGSSGAGARLHYAHVVVLDDFVGEAERGALLDLLTAPGWDHAQVRAVAARMCLACACGPERPAGPYLGLARRRIAEVGAFPLCSMRMQPTLFVY